MEQNIKQISMTCHAAHRAYCVTNNIPTQPVWEGVEDNHKKAIYKSVFSILNGDVVSAVESHVMFLASKKEAGWVFGEEYSIPLKTNPRLVPYYELSVENRTKEDLFFAIVQSFIH